MRYPVVDLRLPFPHRHKSSRVTHSFYRTVFHSTLFVTDNEQFCLIPSSVTFFGYIEPFGYWCVAGSMLLCKIFFKLIDYKVNILQLRYNHTFTVSVDRES
jgi:hypothetical protein